MEHHCCLPWLHENKGCRGLGTAPFQAKLLSWLSSWPSSLACALPWAPAWNLGQHIPLMASRAHSFM